MKRIIKEIREFMEKNDIHDLPSWYVEDLAWSYVPAKPKELLVCWQNLPDEFQGIAIKKGIETMLPKEVVHYDLMQLDIAYYFIAEIKKIGQQSKH